MTNAKPRKRPCSICRTWFLPDVRQKGRQTTCSPKCQKERHRRQCEVWNKKNKPYFKGIYLKQKIQQTNNPPPGKSVIQKSQERSAPPAGRGSLNIPYDVIENDITIRQFVIMRYFIEQIDRRFRLNGAGFT